jgi:hypothetical protein
VKSLRPGILTGFGISEFNLTAHPNHFYTYAILSHSEGRLAIVTDAGRDAMDAGQRTDERCCLADGEVVWS